MRQQSQLPKPGDGAGHGALQGEGRDVVKERKGLIAIVAAAIVVVMVVGVYLTMFLTSSP